MVEIEFSYRGINTTVQCNPEEKFKDILQKLSTKIDINLNSVFYLYSGSVIQNKEKTFIEIANNLDKERKKMNIQITDAERAEENINTIVQSKEIICPECGEKCFFEINNYKIRLNNCINDHDIDEIALEEFKNTQKIDESKIKCEICNKMNKANSYNRSFYRCNSCKKNICPLCKDNHDKNHFIIDYEDKNYICPKHNYPYTLYCKTCKNNLCFSCEVEHKNHEIITFGKIMQTEDNLKKQSEYFKNIKDKFIEDIMQIIEILNKVVKSIDKLYKINNDILCYNYKYKNYEMIQNMNTDFGFKFIDEINKEVNICNKFKKIINIYEKIVEKDDEIRIIYRLDKSNDKIKIFAPEFVDKFKNKLKIIYENKEYKLKQEFETKKIQKDKLEIKLKGITNIKNLHEMDGMLCNCNSLLSLPNISKFNKNNNLNKNNLLLKNVILTIGLVEGTSSAGNSCLVQRYLHDIYKQINRQVGTCLERKIIKMDGFKIRLQIYDNPGQENFAKNTENFINLSHGIIFVFDIQDKNSLSSMKTRIQKAKEINKNYVSIICATKCDLTEERQFTSEDLRKLELEQNMKVFETSALTGKNVHEAFEELLRLIIDKKKKEGKI